MATLPYVTSPGNVEKALNGIKAAATPTTVTQDFVKTILKIQGGARQRDDLVPPEDRLRRG